MRSDWGSRATDGARSLIGDVVLADQQLIDVDLDVGRMGSGWLGDRRRRATADSVVSELGMFGTLDLGQDVVVAVSVADVSLVRFRRRPAHQSASFRGSR